MYTLTLCFPLRLHCYAMWPSQLFVNTTLHSTELRSLNNWSRDPGPYEARWCPLHDLASRKKRAWTWRNVDVTPYDPRDVVWQWTKDLVLMSSWRAVRSLSVLCVETRRNRYHDLVSPRPSDLQCDLVIDRGMTDRSWCQYKLAKWPIFGSIFNCSKWDFHVAFNWKLGTFKRVFPCLRFTNFPQFSAMYCSPKANYDRDYFSLETHFLLILF